MCLVPPVMQEHRDTEAAAVSVHMAHLGTVNSGLASFKDAPEGIGTGTSPIPPSCGMAATFLCYPMGPAPLPGGVLCWGSEMGLYGVSCRGQRQEDSTGTF